MNTAPPLALSRPVVLVGIIALAAGAAIALLPLSDAALLLAVTALAVLVFIEPLGGVIILLLVAPLKALIETEAPASLPIDVGQLALLLVLGAWALNRIVRRHPLALRLSPVQLPLLLFIAAVLLSLPGALSLGKGTAETLKWVEMLALVSLCLAAYGRQEVHWLVFALVVAGSVQALVGLYEFLGGSGAEHLRILGNHFRAFGTFGQPNPFGAFMGITLPLAAGSAWGYAGQVWRSVRNSPSPWKAIVDHEARSNALAAVFYTIAAGLLAGALFASWSRGAWLGLVGTAVVMIFFVPRSLLKSVIMAGLIVAVGLAAWSSGLIPASVNARLSGSLEELLSFEDVRGVDVTDNNYAVIERIAHWQSAVMMAQDHPWLGVGFGNYEVAYPAYALANWPAALGHAHNYYLNLLAEVGIIGFTAYIIAWAMIMVLTLRLWRRSEGLTRAWSIGLLGTWSYLTIHNAVDKLYVNNLFLHLGFTLGLLALLSADQVSGEPWPTQRSRRQQ